MKKYKRDIIAYVMSVPPGAVESIRAYGKREGKKFRVMLILDISAGSLEKEPSPDIDIVVRCDFNIPARIAEALAPYQDELRAITCRAEAHISRFIQVIPHVPYLRTPSTESLKWATDKLEMRRRFRLLAPKYSPKYAVVRANTKAERKRLIEKIRFPMIVKPANLAQSMLVTICYHEDELQRSLASAYKHIEKVYAENHRAEAPKMMVEEYMEGDMYSVDAYVNSIGKIYFCPMVRVVTGKNIGHDEFYNYLHFRRLV
jgi:hypothetical protein